jgi:hypothetical protein
MNSVSKMAGGIYRNCQLLSMTLNEVGFENVALHAMIRQKERLAALTQFRSNIVRILIATDVASRGRYRPVLPVLFLADKHTVFWLKNLKASDCVEDLGINMRTITMWPCQLVYQPAPGGSPAASCPD